MNLPNKITTSRLVMSIGIFILLTFFLAEKDKNVLMLDITFALFIIASISDILDGHLARKYNLSTAFGRIADPLADKVLICGMFVFFSSYYPNLLPPWMTVIIIGREFLVSGLRSYAESNGMAFPANAWGKGKTVTQSVTIGTFLIYLAHLQNFKWAHILTIVLIWITVAITLISGVTYVYSARKLFTDGKNI